MSSARKRVKEELSVLEAFYDLLSPIGMTKEGIKKFNLIEKEFVEDSLKEYTKYKSFEKELGISLLILVNALKNGIWVKTKNGISHIFTVSVRKWLQTNTYCLYYRPYTHVWFEDYGKTWALTKEELSCIEKPKK